MDSTQNEVQKLQKQLNETNQKLQRSLDLAKELKIEKDRLVIENYALIRQNAILKNRYENIKNGAATVTQCATNLQKITNDILQEAQTQHSIAKVLVQPQPTVQVPKLSVDVTQKPTVQLSPKPVSAVAAVAAIVKQPIIKRVHFSPGQMLQIKQKEDVKEKIQDSSMLNILDAVGDVAFKKSVPVTSAAPKNVSSVAEPTLSKVPTITDAARKIAVPTKDAVQIKIAPIEDPTLKKVASIEDPTPKKVAPIEQPVPKKIAPIEEPLLVAKVEPKKVLPAKVDGAKTDPKPKSVDAIPAKTYYNENLVKNEPKKRMSQAVVLLDRANVDKLKAKVSSEKMEPLTPPIGRKNKRKTDSDASDDSTKQPRRTRSMARSDKDEPLIPHPMPNPTLKQASNDGKKKAEGHPKVVTSTPRLVPTLAPKNEVKLVGKLGDRNQTDPMKPVLFNLETNHSARTVVYRLGTKRIAKRRQSTLI